MITVQLATTDNAFFKPVELPLPLTHTGLLDAARKKFKAASKQSRLFDARSGAEIRADAVVKLAPGANVMVSGKAGWKGAERLRAARAATERVAAAAAEALAAADAAAIVPAADGERAAQPQLERASAEHEATRSPGAGGVAAPPLQLQLVSFSYDMGQPHDTAANVNARGLPNPGKAAKGLTGLDRRLAREVLASPGAADLCERVVQECLRQIQLHLAAAGAAPAAARGPLLLRVGVGCDRGLHRSVALVEAATARLVRKAEHARSGRNSPGLEVLLRRVQLVDADHRELVRRGGVAGTGVEEEGGERGVDTRSELRLVVAA